MGRGCDPNTTKHVCALSFFVSPPAAFCVLDLICTSQASQFAGLLSGLIAGDGAVDRD